MQERRFYVDGFLESDYDGGYNGSPCHVTCKWILKVARTDSGSIPIWYLIDCEFKNTSAKACVSKTFLYTALPEGPFFHRLLRAKARRRNDDAPPRCAIACSFAPLLACPARCYGKSAAYFFASSNVSTGGSSTVASRSSKVARITAVWSEYSESFPLTPYFSGRAVTTYPFSVFL